jgi:protein-disulfide isomerase
MEETRNQLPDTFTFKRTHFYSVLVVLAFCVGVLVGYIAWGRGTRVAAAPQQANQPAVQPAATQTIRRYDIPTEGYPSTGPADAPIVIVEFSDFQCPFCKRWHDEVYTQLLAAYPGKIRFVYRNLPLTSIHPEAMPSAQASLCANEQNAFWQYHDKLLGDLPLSADLYPQLAADLGLDTAAFNTCMSENRYQTDIQKDMDFALNLGVQSTPTFFINGLAVIGAQPLTAFTQIIDKELAGEIPQ